MRQKLHMTEIVGMLFNVSAILAMILVALLYQPNLSIKYISLGFDFGFFGYFKLSGIHTALGAIGLILVIIFSAYWCFNVLKYHYKTLGPVHLLFAFACMLFLNGYKTVNGMDGICLLTILLFIGLIYTLITSFVLYVLNLSKMERNKKQEEMKGNEE